MNTPMTDAAAPPPTRQPYSADELEREADRVFHDPSWPPDRSAEFQRELDRRTAMLRQAASQARVLAGLSQWLDESIASEMMPHANEYGCRECEGVLETLQQTAAELDRLVAREGQDE